MMPKYKERHPSSLFQPVLSILESLTSPASSPPCRRPIACSSTSTHQGVKVGPWGWRLESLLALELGLLLQSLPLLVNLGRSPVLVTTSPLVLFPIFDVLLSLQGLGLFSLQLFCLGSLIVLLLHAQSGTLHCFHLCPVCIRILFHGCRLSCLLALFLPGSQSICNRFSQHWREPPINPVDQIEQDDQGPRIGEVIKGTVPDVLCPRKRLYWWLDVRYIFLLHRLHHCLLNLLPEDRVLHVQQLNLSCRSESSNKS